ncbi:DUF624 domain-containing protein (plasmid) [Bacillus sp. F19]|nr:DUF624 domain-containing protein [Bacillus sp. F19]
MEEQKVLGGLYIIMNWISKLFILQVCWLLFILIGLGIFGIFPATAAMFAISRKWIQGERDIPIFYTFKKYYFNDFSHANFSGWSMVTVGFILFFYLRLFKGLDGVIFDLLFFSIVILSNIYIFMWLLWAPVFVHFQLSIIQMFKTCFLLTLGNPFHAIAMLSSCGLFYLLVKMIPGLIPFLSFSVLAFVLMWFSFQIFNRTRHSGEGIT